MALNASFNDVLIQDVFDIRIVAGDDYPKFLPTLEEIGGRTQQIVTKYGIKDLRSLHRNPNGTACVCVKQMERRKFPFGSDLTVFVEELAVPYLYALSHFDQTGKWPWGELSHGALGLLEFYADEGASSSEDELREVAALIKRDPMWRAYFKQARRPNGERRCLCGSKKRFRDCHPRAWKGVSRLHQELKRQGVKNFAP